MAQMDRRSFLTAAAGSALACAAPPAPDRHALRIKITGVDTHLLRVNDRGHWLVVEVKTDAGLTGLGDASHSKGGLDDPALGKIADYAELLAGRSIYDVEWLRGKTFPDHPDFGRAASCAVSGIEQAMWDLQGQVAGVPMYALFGGKLFDEVRNYANINRSTDQRTPEGFAAMAQSAVEAGFDAVKMASYDGMPRNGSAAEIAAHTKLGTDCLRAVREVLGPDRDLLVDGHSNFDLERGLALIRDLEDLNLFWVEEPARPFDILAKIREAAPMPLAGGESLFSVEEYLPYIQAETVDITMPDIKYVGGALELKKVAAMAEAAGMLAAPHGPASPIGNMAAAQVCVTMPNFSILEFSHGDAPWRAELTDPPEPLGPGGMLRVPDTPGLGYKLNRKTVESRRVS